jgi:hypothetical protein
MERASKADERAGRIESANRQLALSLEIERQKTARSQKEAAVARLALESRVRTQGPRYFLLRSSASGLARELSRFSGQKAALLICGMYRTDRETLETWGSLARGASWKMVRSDPIWNGCSLSMQGIGVMVSSGAPQTRRDAAEALSQALDATLPDTTRILRWSIRLGNNAECHWYSSIRTIQRSLPMKTHR